MCVTIKPFVKWAGGKSQLLPEIRKKYPKTIKKYCEPFVGGGAVLLDILANFQPEEILINDINEELINVYKQVRDNSDSLIFQLRKIQEIFWNADIENRKSIYLEKRACFNNIIMNGDIQSELEKAVLFIFLNKTCFNGLYRVNSKGIYNVPMGSYKKPVICDEESLQFISGLLQNVEIRCGDYSQCYDFIDDSTFVYIDPPYRPLSETSSFNSYTKYKFGDEQQIELGKFIEEISNIGAKFVASNSDPKNIDKNDDFFDIIYKKFKIDRVKATRRINSKGSNRGSINELLICNY